LDEEGRREAALFGFRHVDRVGGRILGRMPYGQAGDDLPTVPPLAGLALSPDRSPGRRRRLDLPEYGQLVVFVLLVSLPLLLLDVAMRRSKPRRRGPGAPD